VLGVQPVACEIMLIYVKTLKREVVVNLEPDIASFFSMFIHVYALLYLYFYFILYFCTDFCVMNE